jgi:hypothetical protein
MQQSNDTTASNLNTRRFTAWESTFEPSIHTKKDVVFASPFSGRPQGGVSA